MRKAWRTLSNMKRIEELLRVLEERYGDQVRERMSDESGPFKVLIRTVLSQRTRDANTAEASEQLFKVADSPEEILGFEDNELKELIRPAGMYNQKSERIKEISKRVLEDFDGEVPETRKELLELPGVGYKTADITLMYGHGIPSIGIDTHCKRIPKRIGITEEGDDVEEIKEKLEERIPKDKWYLVNVGIVKFGQDICQPRNPKCNICPFTEICNYYQKNN